MIMRQEFSLPILIVYWYSVSIWSKHTSLLPNRISPLKEECNPVEVVATTTIIPFISSEVEDSLYKTNSTEICFNCTEAIFERNNDHNTSWTTFNITLKINHHSRNISDHILHAIVTISPLGQHSEEVSTINFATTEGYTSSTVCVTSLHKNCDVLSTFPLVSSEGTDVRSLSYAIGFESSKDMMYYFVHANGETPAIYYSPVDFTLNRYKMVFQILGTSADVTHTASVKSLSNPSYANLTSYSSISHGDCNTAKPYCKIMPGCLEESELCHYETETDNDDKVVFSKTTETPRTFQYDINYHSGLELIKLDLEGTSGQISFIKYDQYPLDALRISNSFAEDGSLQLNIHLNPNEQFQSKNSIVIHLSNLCTPFSIIVMFKVDSSCSVGQEPPEIFIFIEDKMILLGYMSSKYKTLSTVKISGRLKVLDVNSISNKDCGAGFSVSLSTILVSVFIVFIISLMITLFLKRIRKERENMAFLVNSTISHHADKEYSKSAARDASARGDEHSEKIGEEIELKSIHDNLYYEESS